MLGRLFSHSLLIGPAPPSPLDVQCPAYPAVVFRPDSARDHPSTGASPVFIPAYQKETRLPFPHTSLPETHFSSLPSPPPRLPDPHRCRSHTGAEIYFNVDFRFCSAAACCHHISRNLPPPSYPTSFAYTSNICHRATHYATVACLLLI